MSKIKSQCIIICFGVFMHLLQKIKKKKLKNRKNELLLKSPTKTLSVGIGFVLCTVIYVFRRNVMFKIKYSIHGE